jgi:hypothetical protein
LVHNHFPTERHLDNRNTYMQTRGRRPRRLVRPFRRLTPSWVRQAEIGSHSFDVPQDKRTESFLRHVLAPCQLSCIGADAALARRQVRNCHPYLPQSSWNEWLSYALEAWDQNGMESSSGGSERLMPTTFANPNFGNSLRSDVFTRDLAFGFAPTKK